MATEERTYPTGAADPRELGAGESVGDWVIQQRLAGGGFGTVYEVQHRRSKQRAALKLLHAHLVTSAEMLARFDREVRVIGQLRHPNIVELVDAGFTRDGQPYLCMELVEGTELTKWIERDGRLSTDAVLAVLEPLCDALATAHDLGIVHRDVKASNIVVGPAAPGEVGRVVLLDFGIAKLSDALAPELTASHQSLGTPSSMAPEQIHGRPVDARTDVYALGALVFHMLAGRLPFEDASSTMMQYLHLHARRPRVSSVAPVPPRLDDVVIRAMAIEPSDRFTDPRSMVAAIRAALRQSTMLRVVNAVDAVAVLMTVQSDPTTLDESLLNDLEAVLPVAERFLAARDFLLAVDLGSSAIFAKPGDAAAAIADAVAMWDVLERRERRDPRVKVGVCVHRGPATFVGTEIRAPELLRTASWQIPDPIEGLWVTSAIEPGGTKRLR